MPRETVTGEDFGWRVRRARLRLAYLWCREVSQGDLARMAGVSQATVSRWEAGQRPPTGVIEDLAKVLGVPAGFLAYGDHGDLVELKVDAAAPPVPRIPESMDTKKAPEKGAKKLPLGKQNGAERRSLTGQAKKRRPS